MTTLSREEGRRVVYVEGVFIHQTEAAVLVEIERRGKVWIPKSLLAKETEVISGSQGEEECAVFIPLWFAEKESIPYNDMPEEEES